MRQVKNPASRPASRIDPAPSLTAYRVQRLMLTRGVRNFLKLGLPVLGMLAVVGMFLASTERREAIWLQMSEFRSAIEERPEFMVKLLAIDGADDLISADIREILPIEFPITAFDLDLEKIQQTITKLDTVARADVLVRGGILQINVTQRMPVLVWRGADETLLLDETGHRVASLEVRSDRSDLPLIAGMGAGDHVGQALDILIAATPLMDRVRGLQRVGQRRWDLVLDRDQRILLPEENPADALMRVIALSDAQDMLARDLTIIDMRNGHRPTIRIAQTAIKDLRRIRGQ